MKPRRPILRGLDRTLAQWFIYIVVGVALVYFWVNFEVPQAISRGWWNN